MKYRKLRINKTRMTKENFSFMYGDETNVTKFFSSFSYPLKKKWQWLSRKKITTTNPKSDNSVDFEHIYIDIYFGI